MRRIAAVSIMALFAAWPAMAQTSDISKARPDPGLTGSTGAPPSDCVTGDLRPACDIAAVNRSIAGNRAPSPGSTVAGDAAAGRGGSATSRGTPAIAAEPQSAARNRLESNSQREPLGAAEERGRLGPATAGSGLDRTNSNDTSTTGTASGSTGGLSGSSLGAAGGSTGSSATPGGGRASRSSGGSSGGGSGR